MTLVQITANLDRVTEALERIATSLEIYIRPTIAYDRDSYGKSELNILSDEDLWLEEQEKARQRELGEPV